METFPTSVANFLFYLKKKKKEEENPESLYLEMLITSQSAKSCLGLSLCHGPIKFIETLKRDILLVQMG